MKTTSKAYSWCYTWNNYTEEDIVRLESIEALRHICAKEVGETGTPHLQGYIRFKDSKRFSWWKNQFPKVHVEVRKGTEEEAVAYCEKDGEIVINEGEPEARPTGKRTREEIAQDVQTMAAEGASFKKICLKYPSLHLYNRRGVQGVIADFKHWAQNPACESWSPDL